MTTNVVVGTTNAVEHIGGSTVPTFWDSYGSTIIVATIVVAAFAYLWRQGHLTRFSNYVRLTREELRKCSWPTWTELKGSTVVISIGILLIGLYTVLVDFVFSTIIRLIT